MGVLQRLGICYGIVALLAVTVRHRVFPTIIAVLLVGYYSLQLFGNGFEKCAGNIVSMVVSVLGSRRKSVVDLYIQRNCRRVIP